MAWPGSVPVVGVVVLARSDWCGGGGASSVRAPLRGDGPRL
jgi:hypothetical protein